MSKRFIVGVLFAIAALFIFAAPSHAESDTEVWWLVPEGAVLYSSDDARGDGSRVGPEAFPQTQIEPGELACGRMAQVDTYSPDDAEWITQDKMLYDGEDWDQVKTWHFEEGMCGPTPPTLVDTGISGTWMFIISGGLLLSTALILAIREYY